jgi:hypothetical protein
MRHLWMVAAIAMLGCSTALAQVGGMNIPTPGIAATSPLGTTGDSQLGTSVGPTGIPLGATELTSPGISPMFTDPTGMMASGTTCSASASTSTGISGGISGVSTYDGGGLSIGGGMPLGGVASCAPASSGMASPPTSVSPTSAFRTGIPLGSVEVGSAGVSPLLVAPTSTAPSSSIGTIGASLPLPTTPMPPSTSLAPPIPTTGTGFATNQSSMPCGTIVTSGPATFC